MDIIDLLADKELFPYFETRTDIEFGAFMELGQYPIGSYKDENGRDVVMWENNKKTRRFLAVQFLLKKISQERKEAKEKNENSNL